MKKIMLSMLCLILAVVTLVGVTKNDVLAKTEFENLTAKSYIVIDDSGNVLVEKNAHEKYEVASICKLMTTLLTLEKIDEGKVSLKDKFVASEYACSVEGSQAFLDSGSEYLVSDLLKSVIVASANDSAVVLAENIGGSEENFVKLMNKKAQDVGMNDTLYANSTGLPANNQYSTAYDTSLLLDIVSKYDIYKNDCKIWMDKLVHPSGRETELVNTNRLIKYYPYCQTGKTGFTDEAGYCLSSTALKNNMHLTCVVLGCDNMANRFKESMELYNYVFANFTSEKVVDKSVNIQSIKVTNGRENEIIAVPEEDYFVTTDDPNNTNVEIEYNICNKVKAPVVEGDVVGEIIVKRSGEVVKKINAVASTNVDTQKFVDVLDKIMDKFPVF